MSVTGPGKSLDLIIAEEQQILGRTILGLETRTSNCNFGDGARLFTRSSMFDHSIGRGFHQALRPLPEICRWEQFIAYECPPDCSLLTLAGDARPPVTAELAVFRRAR